MGRLSLEELTNPGLLDTEVDDVDNHEQLEAEAQTQIDESEAEQQDLDRSLDLAESLECIRETLSANSNWTPSEIRLAGIATEMAYAGCDSTVKGLPALESGDRNVALEGIGSRIMGVLRTIGNAMARMWAGMKERLRAFADLFRSYEAIISRFEREIDALRREGKTETSIKLIKTFGCAVGKDGSPILDFGKIVSRFKDVEGTLEKLSVSYNKSVKVITAGYGKWELFKDLLDVEKAGREFFKNTVTSAEAIRGSGHFTSEVRKGRVVYTSDVFPGGYVIRVTEPEKRDYSSNDYHDIKQASNKFSVFATVNKDSKEYLDRIDLAKPVKLNELAAMVTELRSMAVKMHRTFNEVEHLLENEQVALEKTINSIEGAISRGVGTLIDSAAGNGVSAGNVKLTPTKIFLSSYRIMTTNNDMVLGGVHTLFTLASNACRSGVAMTRFLVMRGKWV